MSKFNVFGRLFSKTDEAAKALKREKGTGEEFLREIQKTPSVKAAEIKDRKLDKVLPTMGKTTKAEVLKKLEQNPPPKIEEKVKGGMDTSDLDAYREPDDSWNIRRISDQSFVTNVRGFGDDPEGAIQEAARRMSGEEGTKYGQYTIPGGENYREILLRLPVRPKDGVSVTQTGTGRWRVTFPDGSSDLYRTEQEAMANAGGRGSYHSTHWEEPNVLAHARVSDRVGPNGERILHVEEIQSDWHQQGRKQGYQDPNILEQKAKAEAARAEAKKVLDEAQEKVRAAKSYVSQYEAKINSPEFQNAPPEYQQSITALRDRFTQAWMRDLPELMKAQKEFDALPDPATMKTAGVPDAPFKKNWHELTMKRILDYAADKGYDKIAITPGAEQAKRYDLSRQINNLSYRRNEDGTYIVVGQDKDMRQFRLGDNLTEDQLADNVGKEVAQKIINGEGQEFKPFTVSEGMKKLSGVDLQVGGEGMKGFYDQILPTYLNDLGKPYGATVGEMRLPAPPKDSSVVSGYTLGDEYMQGRATWSEFLQANPRAAEEFGVSVHTFDITPQMREEIKTKGLPLYQVGAPIGAGAAQQALPTEEPEGPPVQFTDNPDVMQLELARGGAVRMDEGGSIRPTEVKNRAALGASEALNKLHGFVSEPFGMKNPPMEIISDLIGIPALAKTLERLGYGERLTTGKGMTLKPKEETVDALLAATSFIPLTKGLPVGAATKKAEKAPAVPLEIPRVRPTKEAIESAAERVGRQQLGEFVRSPLLNKTTNLAGRSKKEVDRLKELEYKLTPIKDLPEMKPYEAKVGEVNIALPGDQTVSDMLLESVDNIPIGTTSEGGAFFGRGRLTDPEEKRAFWSSNFGPASNFQNKVTEIAKLYDTDLVTAYHLAMGQTANNFARHLADANLRAIDFSKLSKKQMDLFDAEIAAGYPKKDPETGKKIWVQFPDWPGIANPEEALIAMEKNPELRKWFNNRMKTEKVTKESDLPYGRAIEWAMSEPELRNMEINLTGLSAGRMKPGAELIPDSAHQTYSHDIPGTALGRAPELAPFEISFPDVTSFVREKYRPQDFTGTIQKVFPHQIVDEAYLEDMQKYYDQLRKVRGYAEGGEVEKKAEDDSKPRKNVTFTDNLDAMRLAVGNK